ncbi:MAG: phytanoyl-CoA dioxygenase family protein [Actinomycetota bacterium]|nr:phytanoyl-CoA dioxygenase family protein [Actinomycetota bacterium]MEC9316199.1 phytanoyl-CoA dioxygenase family protein [Actinomycetota bacterium]MEE3139928.1 phytanoyl-CoA dioxygenase family protein [Actinomycetota bacterium]
MVDVDVGDQTITSAQRESYERGGYLHLEAFVDLATLDALSKASAEFVELSRELSASGKILDLEPGHTADAPRIRRLNSPVDQHETFRRFSLEGPVAKLACDLLGGPVRYHHSKLNFKWSDGGEEVKWHQDIQFWPHTDFSPLTIGVYLADVDDEMGPMGVLPGSHVGRLYDQYESGGLWNGALSDSDAESLDLSKVVWLSGSAGSVTVHNCCTVHGSAPNNSTRPRPLLLQTYSRVDSYPVAHIGANGVTGPLSGTVIGGQSSQRIVVQGREVVGAPDWSRGGAPTIFGSQQQDI